MSIKRCTACGTYFDTIGDILDHNCPTREDAGDDNDPTAVADGGTTAHHKFDATTKLRLRWHSGDVEIQTEPMAPDRARELQQLLRTATVTLDDGNQRPLVDGHVIEREPVEAEQ